jgi:hypothetical protein
LSCRRRTKKYRDAWSTSYTLPEADSKIGTANGDVGALREAP